MTLIDALLIANSTGVMGLAAAAIRWAWSVERRITVIETKQG